MPWLSYLEFQRRIMAVPAFAKEMGAHLQPRPQGLLADIWHGSAWAKLFTRDPIMSADRANFVLIISTDGKILYNMLFPYFR